MIVLSVSLMRLSNASGAIVGLALPKSSKINVAEACQEQECAVFVALIHFRRTS